MAMLTAQELRDKAPKQFEKEHMDWVADIMRFDWWDHIEKDFIERCEPMGICVDRIFFSGFYYQGDHAGFEGSVKLGAYMARMKLDEQYPALYQAAVDDGSYMQCTQDRHGISFHLHEDTYYSSPSGVFADLDEETWRALVDSEWRDSELEHDVQDSCKDLAYGLWRELQDEYEHITSEEAFIEDCDYLAVVFEYEGEEE